MLLILQLLVAGVSASPPFLDYPYAATPIRPHRFYDERGKGFAAPSAYPGAAGLINGPKSLSPHTGGANMRPYASHHHQAAPHHQLPKPPLPNVPLGGAPGHIASVPFKGGYTGQGGHRGGYQSAPIVGAGPLSRPGGYPAPQLGRFRAPQLGVYRGGGAIRAPLQPPLHHFAGGTYSGGSGFSGGYRVANRRRNNALRGKMNTPQSDHGFPDQMMLEALELGDVAAESSLAGEKAGDHGFPDDGVYEPDVLDVTQNDDNDKPSVQEALTQVSQAVNSFTQKRREPEAAPPPPPPPPPSDEPQRQTAQEQFASVLRVRPRYDDRREQRREDRRSDRRHSDYRRDRRPHRPIVEPHRPRPSLVPSQLPPKKSTWKKSYGYSTKGYGDWSQEQDGAGKSSYGYENKGFGEEQRPKDFDRHGLGTLPPPLPLNDHHDDDQYRHHDDHSHHGDSYRHHHDDRHHDSYRREPHHRRDRGEHDDVAPHQRSTANRAPVKDEDQWKYDDPSPGIAALTARIGNVPDPSSLLDQSSIPFMGERPLSRRSGSVRLPAQPKAGSRLESFPHDEPKYEKSYGYQNSGHGENKDDPSMGDERTYGFRSRAYGSEQLPAGTV